MGPRLVNPAQQAALIYGSVAGAGGLGHSVACAITGLSRPEQNLSALGPGYREPWSLAGGLPKANWLCSPESIPAWRRKYTLLRWRGGDLVFQRDAALGRWAAENVARLHPAAVYAFTQVGRESLQWARQHEVFSVLDNPNGHISNFRRICEQESERWCGSRFLGHPSPAMVDRIGEEYELADRICVYSEWGKQSLMAHGVSADKVKVVRQTINFERFRPPAIRLPASGPLRVCYVGSLDLRKGFVYLLRAIRALGGQHVLLDIVGATGDRHCARLFDREKRGLQVKCAPGDPLRAYHESEIFVLPTLEDGFGFVVPEAMACGLPVVVTDQCGARDCARPDVEGWIIPSADVDALAATLDKALQFRRDLPDMGRQARSAIEKYCAPANLNTLGEWFYSQIGRAAALRRETACSTSSQ